MTSIRGDRVGMGAVAVTATALLLSSCGSLNGSSAPQQPPAPTVTVTQPAEQESQAQSEDSEESTSDSQSGAPSGGGGACQTSSLRAKFYPDNLAELQGQSPEMAGEDTYGSHASLRLANVGAEPCTVNGQVRLEFVGFNGETLPMNVMENHAGPSAGTVTLATRNGASQKMWWNVSPSPCSDPAKVRVYPPENAEPIVLDWNFGAVCAGSRLLSGHLSPS